MPALPTAAVVTSTIAKGRIARIDASEALRVAGVLDVLTHENRPPHGRLPTAPTRTMSRPEGSPFRPLYDDRIRFNGQPIALVRRRRPEIARFAASLVRVEYDREDARHRPASPARRGLRIEAGRDPFGPPKPRGDAEQALARRSVRHEARILRPDRASQSDGAVRLDRDVGGRRQAHGLRQDAGRAERAALSVRRVRHEAGRCARHVALRRRRLRLRAAAAISGGAGGAGGARAEALGAPRADPAADVRARLPAGHDPAPRARRERRRDARRDHARGDRRDLAIRGLLPARDRLVGPALQVRQRADTRTSSRGSILPTPCDMRAPGAATGVYALECAMDELAVALKLDPLELRLRCYSDRDQNDGRAVHQQEPARVLPPGRGGLRLGQAQSRAALDARRRASWSAGAWRRASGRRCRCRSRCASC